MLTIFAESTPLPLTLNWKFFLVVYYSRLVAPKSPLPFQAFSKILLLSAYLKIRCLIEFKYRFNFIDRVITLVYKACLYKEVLTNERAASGTELFPLSRDVISFFLSLFFCRLHAPEPIFAAIMALGLWKERRKGVFRTSHVSRPLSLAVEGFSSPNTSTP